MGKDDSVFIILNWTKHESAGPHAKVVLILSGKIEVKSVDNCGCGHLLNSVICMRPAGWSKIAFRSRWHMHHAYMLQIRLYPLACMAMDFTCIEFFCVPEKLQDKMEIICFSSNCLFFWKNFCNPVVKFIAWQLTEFSLGQRSPTFVTWWPGWGRGTGLWKWQASMHVHSSTCPSDGPAHTIAHQSAAPQVELRACAL